MLLYLVLMAGHGVKLWSAFLYALDNIKRETASHGESSYLGYAIQCPVLAARP